MKCIRIITSNEIQRVTNAQARTEVAAGRAVYVPKAEWKLAGRPR